MVVVAQDVRGNKRLKGGYRPWSVEDSQSPLDARLEAEVTPDALERIAEDPQLQALEYTACARSPWYWLVNYVVTEDAHWIGKKLDTAYQRFPAYEALRSACYVLWRYPFTTWPKSRQVRMTWLVSAMMAGEAQFVEGRLDLVQSKKAVDSEGVLRRMQGILERQNRMAPWLGSAIKAQGTTHIEFQNGSEIYATAQGAHHVQSYTPAWLFLDEAQLQDEAEGAYYQALPACERITMVGTADFSWFFETFLPDKLAQRV